MGREVSLISLYFEALRLSFVIYALSQVSLLVPVLNLLLTQCLAAKGRRWEGDTRPESRLAKLLALMNIIGVSHGFL